MSSRRPSKGTVRCAVCAEPIEDEDWEWHPQGWQHSRCAVRPAKRDERPGPKTVNVTHHRPRARLRSGNDRR